MIAVSAALQEYLATRQEALTTELLTLTLMNGPVARLTLADRELTLGGYTFTAWPAWKRDRLTLASGLEVSTLKLTLEPRIYPYSAESAAEADVIGGFSWYEAALLGLLDHAEVLLEKAFFWDWDDPAGQLPLFAGRIDSVESDDRLQLTVKSFLDQLKVRLPHNFYQPGCRHNLYDAGCGLDREDYARAEAAQAGSSAALVRCSQAEAASYFDLGYLVFVGGANAGVRRTIRNSAPGELHLILPLPRPPAAGDLFTLYPGCGRTLADCEDKFDNLLNYGGEPYIPVPEILR